MHERIPNVIQYPADYSGCGFWRMLWPGFILNMSQKMKVYAPPFFLRDYLHYVNASVVHIQRQGLPIQVRFYKKLAALRDRNLFRIVYDIDDILFTEDIPPYLAQAKQFFGGEEIRQGMQELMELSDEMTVSTPFLKEYYLKKTKQKKITVIPNFPPRTWLGNHYSETYILHNYHKHRKRPRILYAGSASHFHYDPTGKIKDDFSHVEEAIISSRKDFCYIFIGGFPKVLSPYIQKGEIEFYPWQTLDKYPQFLSTLEGNMWIAPLQENLFNQGKSDIKFLEACSMGLPIACQDMITYREAPIRFKTGREMVEALQKTLADEETYIKASRRGREIVEEKWLEKEANLQLFLDLYQFKK